jgi:serine O-acetyltransferase
MIAQVLVKTMGGLWKIKEKISKTNSSSPNTLLLFIYEAYLREWGGWIGPYSNFDGQPFFPHGLSGVFIADGTNIGKNCIIMQQVTIGSNTLIDAKKPGQPTIGADCFIGAGAKIIGGIKVGNNCRIGANCVVFTDMPDNSLIVLQSPRVISREGINNRFYKKTSDGNWVYYNDSNWLNENNKDNLSLLKSKFG